MGILGWAIIGILGMLAGISLFNVLSAPSLENKYELTETPMISVLIPARNEEETIQRCVESLLRQTYPDFEVLILDDYSTDGTGQVLEELSGRDSRIKVFTGKPLPDGWTGKNWACHQLSRKAGGDILVFTDADNWYHAEALRNTIRRMDQHDLDTLSAFPQQITGTLTEKLVVPYVDVLLYSLLPLWATYLLPFPSMAAANGQWLAFRKEVYSLIGGHQAVRGEPVEDTVLARRVKQKGARLLTAAGTGYIFGRMYRSFGEVWEGFTKNLYGLAGYRAPVFFAVLLMLFLIGVGPVLMVFIPGWAVVGGIGMVLNGFIRFVLAIRFRHPVWISVFLHPVSVVLTLAIGLNSFLAFRRGRVRWKGRTLWVGGR